MQVLQDDYMDNTKNKTHFIADLYKKDFSRLKRTLQSLLRNEATAEDIAQDAFIKINNLEQPQSLEYPYAYLYRTAINLVKDKAKAQRVRDDYKQYIALDEENYIEFISPEHRFLAQEQLKLALKAIDALPPKCRKVFLLHRVENLSHKEISNKIGISKFAVEKHIVRAMIRCKDYFLKTQDS